MHYLLLVGFDDSSCDHAVTGADSHSIETFDLDA